MSIITCASVPADYQEVKRTKLANTRIGGGGGMVFYTVGYARRDITGFISELEERSIDLLVDVREYPLSRKKGFSKTSLSESLKRSGIEYVHFRELGSSRELRKKYVDDGDYGYFKEHFKASFDDRRDTLQLLLAQTATKTICLMCCEANWNGCHRGILAEEIISLNGGGTAVEHL
jgi:uncharacterized protein (DUF488 family)